MLWYPQLIRKVKQPQMLTSLLYLYMFLFSFNNSTIYRFPREPYREKCSRGFSFPHRGIGKEKLDRSFAQSAQLLHLSEILHKKIMCQFFVVLYNTRNFYLKILLRYGQRLFGKKKNNEKAPIKLAHTRASQTLEIVAAF